MITALKLASLCKAKNRPPITRFFLPWKVISGTVPRFSQSIIFLNCQIIRTKNDHRTVPATPQGDRPPVSKAANIKRKKIFFILILFLFMNHGDPAILSTSNSRPSKICLSYT